LAPLLFVFTFGPPDSPNFFSLNLSSPLTGLGVLGPKARMKRVVTVFP